MAAQRRRRTTRPRPARRRPARRYGFDDLAVDVLTLVALAYVVALLCLEVAWRFVAGQVVLRRPGRWDALWGSWAPPLPKRMQGRRDVAAPRTSWGRRPGWQRQLVRVGVVVLAAGIWRAPTVTALVIAGAAFATGLGVAVVLARRWTARTDGDHGDGDEDQGGDGGGEGESGGGAAVLEHRRRARPRRAGAGAVVVPAPRGGRAVGDLEVLLDLVDLDALVATMPRPAIRATGGPG